MISREGDPVRFFERVYADYCEAESRSGGPVTRHLAVGSFTIQLRFAGTAMLKAILPSLAHLPGDSASQPKLTVCICDSASGRICLREPPWPTEVTRNGLLPAYCDDEASAFFQMESSTLSLLRHAQKLGIYWAPSPDRVMLGESAHPLLWLLQSAMSRAGYQFVHAGGVGSVDGGVLLAGGNGSGKSTVALACLLGGLEFAGDDFVVLEDRNIPWVHSLYSSAKICDDVLPWFADVGSFISNPNRAPGEKVLLQVSEGSLGTISHGFAVKAVLFPELCDATGGGIAPVSAGESLARLAPSSILPLPGAGRQEFLRLASFVRRVPSFTLGIGRDLAAVVDTIRRFLAKPERRPAG